MTYKILVMGLPGAGKTTLSAKIVEKLRDQGETCDWFNGDEVRRQTDNWDFSSRGRLEQASSMKTLCCNSQSTYVMVDFVAPMVLQRELLSPDFIIWLDTIKESRYDDTNKIFVPPHVYNIKVDTKDSLYWSEIVINKINDIKRKT